ncbi:MAG: FHIPEP family type III secretion protein [Armatimonadetes bacterium]|nr:FHIPEP family type III secretion protein [Armatimonadota bacterium]
MSAAVAPIQGKPNLLKFLASRTEIPMAAAAIGIVVLLVLPLPTPVIDLMLVFNLALSMSVLLATTYLTDPLEFSVFPSLLLFTALYRLALSLSVTRAILEVVQFIVVTGGTTRTAEVVARFTLDAMPGKQMAIDADLNAGIITEDEARRRRRKISSEADFYGAMDGASKFVRGDGIAALIVTTINILGGVVIGVAQLGMSPAESLQTYALLTVGQGLVIQIPGLLMSVASGLVVTRAASEQNLSGELLTQITNRPEALAAAAAGCCVLGLLPGLPTLPLLALGGGLALLARHAYRKVEREALRTGTAAAADGGATPAAEDTRQHLPLDTLELEVGYGLVPLAMKSEGGQLLERITGLRKSLAQEMGLLVPPVRVRDNVTMNPNGYVLRMRGVEVARGEILPRFFLALNGGNVSQPLDGDHVLDPTFGLPATWITPEQRGEAQRRGYIVIDAATVCVTHLSEALKAHAAQLLTRQELAQILDVAKAEHAAVVDDLVPEVVSKAALQTVLQNLLEERVPVRDIVTILEALGEAAARTQSLDEMTEYTRRRLARTVVAPLLVEGELPAMVLDPALERRLADAIGETAFGAQLQLPPNLMQGFIDSLGRQVEAAAADGHNPILICSSRVRLPLRRLTRKFLSRLVVLAYDEVAETAARLKTLGMVTVLPE